MHGKRNTSNFIRVFNNYSTPGSAGAICKTFMDNYINQSCPNYIRLLIEIIGTFSIPVIVSIITMVIMLRKHNWMK